LSTKAILAATARKRTLSVAVLAAIGVVCAPLPAAALGAGHVEGAQAIAFLNDQRAANDIPPVIENQLLASAWCPAEDTGPSGGESARVLSPLLASWSPTSSPWDDAPLHQQAMYNPAYTQAGDVDAAGQACLGIGAPLPEPPVPTFAAFYSDTGPHDVPTTETVAHEEPLAPQQLVGIPQGRPTGGQIMLYAEGMGEQVEPVSWTLAEADGTPVANVRMADEQQAGAAGYPGYLTGVGVLIPPVLKAESAYTLTVVWRGASEMPATQTLSFTTGPATNKVYLSLQGAFAYGESDAPGGALTLSRAGRTLRVAITRRVRDGRYRARLSLAHLHPGHWRLCIASGGQATGFQPQRQCAGLVAE
jgi:hypothetical protein